jgi:hypothetical protein
LAAGMTFRIMAIATMRLSGRLAPSAPARMWCPRRSACRRSRCAVGQRQPKGGSPEQPATPRPTFDPQSSRGARRRGQRTEPARASPDAQRTRPSIPTKPPVARGHRCSLAHGNTTSSSWTSRCRISTVLKPHDGSGAQAGSSRHHRGTDRQRPGKR